MSNAKKLSINVAWVSCSTVRGVTSDIGVTLTKKKKTILQKSAKRYEKMLGELNERFCNNGNVRK